MAMDGGWLLLAVLAAVAAPLALAWWLLGRPERRRPAEVASRHGKIPSERPQGRAGPARSPRGFEVPGKAGSPRE
ncbi:MAG: hypothetical protein MUF03_14415 [Rubrivivax sp.]|jgi:hypothetical protein|nr:hypothetical protein [Rubrivivax sp.]